jgi:hypothetical protein
MTQTKIVMILFWLLVCGLWGMNIWGGWAERTYEKTKDGSMTWYWLRLLHIERTERNCIFFIKSISAFGILLLTIGTLLVLLVK